MEGSPLFHALSMKQRRWQHRGVSLVELLIFLAILGAVSSLMLPLLFTASQTRYRQQTVAAVEQNGAQALQDILFRVRGAERILSPTAAHSGSFLVLQTSSGTTNPTVIGLQSGSLILIQHTTQRTLTSPQVGVTDFVVRNTSVSVSKQSLDVSFRLSRATRDPGLDTYTRFFDTAMSLLPNDKPVGGACGCTLPTCPVNNTVNWKVCDSGVCSTSSALMRCP